VLILGGTGLGKSRIVAALEQQLRVERISPAPFLLPYRQDSALYPFIDRSDGQRICPGRYSRHQARNSRPCSARSSLPEEDVAFLADLLSLRLRNVPLPNLSPNAKKERTLERLIRGLEGLALAQPVVAMSRDAHWIDPTSRELLDLAVGGSDLPVLLIVTFRPEFQPPWTASPHVTMLVLNRLDLRERKPL